MNNIMLDLETMGHGMDAAIIAIGAVLFCPESGIGQTFYMPVNLETSVDTGGKMDASTVLWWMRQSDEARAAFHDNHRAPDLHDALQDFDDFLMTFAQPDTVLVWGNGADFDNVILAETYRRAWWPIPWLYTNNRCYRTLKGLYPQVKMTRNGTHHHALDDAISQAQHAIEIMRHINHMAEHGA